MPDKNYSSQNHKKGCGKECTRCWRNKLKHANKLKKKCFPKMFEDNSSNKEEETSKKYNSNIEEFIDKYLVLNYTKDRFNEYNGDAKRYNQLLIDDTTSSYNDWLLKEKKIKKRIKDEKFIELLEKHDYDNSWPYTIPDRRRYIPLEITQRYWPDFYVTAGFYMFECTF